MTTATLRWAAAVVLAQGVGFAALTAVFVYLDVTEGVTTVRMAASVSGYVAVLAGLFLGLGLALARRRGWARGPAVVLELLQLPIGYTIVTTAGPVRGLPVLLAGLLALGLLLAPATRAALGIR